MSQLDYVLQAFNSYIDGVGKLGSGERLQTPKLVKKAERMRGGGMLAERNHVMGYELFAFEAEYNSFDPQIIRHGGLFSKKSVPLSFTAALDGDEDARHTASFTCAGQFIEVDNGDWRAGAKAMLRVRGSLDRLKLVIDGETIYDIDVPANKYVIGDVDEYAWIRAAL
jgi:P2 family phage contractile tail tube protein